MSQCPIGLTCQYMDCNPQSCFQLLKPWPLPFCINPEITEWGLLVEIPTYNNDYGKTLDENELIQQYNEWISHIRQELWRAGWWSPSLLPYSHHPEGGLLVTKFLPMEQSVTIACCLNFEEELDGFEPPVPIDGYQRIYNQMPPESLKEDYINEYRILNDSLLYANNFCE